MIHKIFILLFLFSGLELYGQETSWLLTFGGAGDDEAYDCVASPDGGLLVCGNVRDTADFGPVHLETSSLDMFVMKLSQKGEVLWVSTASSISGSKTTAFGLAVDAENNVYVGGRYSDTTSFGALTVYPHEDELGDAFIAKLNSSGEYLWVKGFTGPAGDQLEKLAVSGNNIVATLRPSNTITIAGVEVKNDYPNASTTFNYAVVVSLSSEGEVNWITKVNGKASFARDIKAGKNGGIFVPFTASMVSATPFITIQGVAGLTPLGNPAGNDDIYLTRLNETNGSVVWVNRIGSAGSEMSYTLSLDSDDNIYCGALVQGQTQLNSIDGNLQKLELNGAKYDYLLCKYSPAGNLQWGNMQGGLENEGAHDIAIAPDGEIYTSAYFLDPETVFGPDKFSIDADGNAGLIIRHDMDGSYLWGRKASAFYNDGTNRSHFYGWGMTMGSDHELLVCGSYEGALSFYTGENFDDPQEGKNIWIAMIYPGDIDTTTVIEPNSVKTADTGKPFFYPNPASRSITLTEPDIRSVDIFDMSGRLVTRKFLSSPEIPILDVPEGFYLVKCKTLKGEVVTQKLIINR